MVLEVKKQENNLLTFSIERFESIMRIVNITWSQINTQFNYNVESMFKAKDKPPMLNVVNKVCDFLGLANSDYVMMKSDTYTLRPILLDMKPDINDNRIGTDIIDAEMLDLCVKESDWNYESLASLMSKKSILRIGVNYLKGRKLSKDDLDNLCYALICKKSAICNISTNDAETVPNRVLNSRQKYIINYALINKLSRSIEKICKCAAIPTWFIYNKDLHVSEEMLNILRKSIYSITGEDIPYNELCVNYNELKTDTKKSKIIFHKKGTKITKKQLDCAMELLKNNTCKKVSELTGISQASIYAEHKKRLNETNEKEIITIIDKKESVMETIKEIKEEKKVDIPTEVKESVKSAENEKQNALTNSKKEKEKMTKTNNKHNYSNQNNKQEFECGSFMSNVFDKVDRMTYDELNKLHEYVTKLKSDKESQKKLRDSLLG